MKSRLFLTVMIAALAVSLLPAEAPAKAQVQTAAFGDKECPNGGVPNGEECKADLNCFTVVQGGKVERWNCKCDKHTKGSEKLTYLCTEKLPPTPTIFEILGL